MIQNTIKIERLFDAPVQKVWNALTDENQMRQWYFPDVNFQPVIGHVTEFNVHHEGKDFFHIWKVTEVKPLKRIAYEWQYGDYPGNSLLSFELNEVENRTTKFTLVHDNLTSFRPGENPELSAQNFLIGWTHFMDVRLKEFLKK